MICEKCHMRSRNRAANYAVRINKIDFYLCYDCLMEESSLGRGKIVKIFKSVYWNDEIKQIVKEKKCHRK